MSINYDDVAMPFVEIPGNSKTPIYSGLRSYKTLWQKNLKTFNCYAMNPDLFDYLTLYCNSEGKFFYDVFDSKSSEYCTRPMQLKMINGAINKARREGV